MLNFIWLGLVLAAVLIGGFSGKLKEVSDGALKGAETAVTLALGLIGVMAIWLGLMRLAERAGLIERLARFLKPVLTRLFPDVPENHPAMGSMVMNIAANMLGLVNAATPFGLRAMRDLETLNRRPGTATNAMCTFLAINTGSVQLIPITAIAVLASAGSKSPAAIVGTSLLATTFSSAAGLIAVKLFEKMPFFRLPPPTSPAPAPGAPASQEPASQASSPPPKPLTSFSVSLLLALGVLFVVFGFIAFQAADPGAPSGTGARVVHVISLLAIPFLLLFFPFYAMLRGLNVYEELVEGAKEGFQVAVKIIPYLVAMLVAITMFRNAGGIDLLTRALAPLLQALTFPPDLLPMALIRPLSGSGSLAAFTDIVKQLGPDHIITRMAGTLYGSTETTFYVIALYFGAVNVVRTRHAVLAGLVADATGIIAAVIICRIVFS